MALRKLLEFDLRCRLGYVDQESLFLWSAFRIWTLRCGPEGRLCLHIGPNPLVGVITARQPGSLWGTLG